MKTILSQSPMPSGNSASIKKNSCWFENDFGPSKFPQLKENLEADVVVVGAGIAGLTAAYCLASSGKKVIVVDESYIGSGESGRTTAQMVTALDDRYYNMEEYFGFKT